MSTATAIDFRVSALEAWSDPSAWRPPGLTPRAQVPWWGARAEIDDPVGLGQTYDRVQDVAPLERVNTRQRCMSQRRTVSSGHTRVGPTKTRWQIIMATDGIHGDMAAAGVSTRRLAEALRAIGIEFPAMMADLPSDDVPMVRLGRIPADTADALARWITSHHQAN